jgi:hypothetical protein
VGGTQWAHPNIRGQQISLMTQISVKLLKSPEKTTYTLQCLQNNKTMSKKPK